MSYISDQCKKTSQFKAQCKSDIRRAFKTAKITVFDTMMCKRPDVPLQAELLVLTIQLRTSQPSSLQWNSKSKVKPARSLRKAFRLSLVYSIFTALLFTGSNDVFLWILVPICGLNWLLNNWHIWSFAQHGVKHSDFCCFKATTYVALTLCFKLRSFLHWFLLFFLNH